MSVGAGKTMITFAEAQRIILERAPRGQRTVELPVAEAAGRILAEEINSPLDMPPFNKSAMDGFAFRHADHRKVPAFCVVRTIAAGEQPQVPLASGECVRIMTGAPVPAAADTVIRVEDTTAVTEPGAGENGADQAERVRFLTVPEQGRNIARRGEDIRVGATALAAGDPITPQGVAILAALGRRSVKTYADPSVAFAATGEELVEPGTPLAPGQIYNSNAYSLWSQILCARGKPVHLGVIRDTVEDLRAKISAGLEHDLLVLSGGVSMGQFDLVPQVLAALGVELIFHKLRVKPAKPALFGMRGQTMVFGLPGNPVSTIYAFDQYVAPAIRAFQRHPQPLTTHYHGRLTADVRKKAGRMFLVACVSRWTAEGYELQPIGTHGSADIFAVAQADALAYIPADVTAVAKGETVGFRKLHGR